MCGVPDNIACVSFMLKVSIGRLRAKESSLRVSSFCTYGDAGVLILVVCRRSPLSRCRDCPMLVNAWTRPPEFGRRVIAIDGDAVDALTDDCHRCFVAREHEVAKR